MPHFLVTHTSLVEADDEATAAEMVQAKIAGGDLVSFDVRADEHRITKIVLRTKVTDEPRLPNSEKLFSHKPDHGLWLPAAGSADGTEKASIPRQEVVRRSRALAYCATAATAATSFILGYYLR